MIGKRFYMNASLLMSSIDFFGERSGTSPEKKSYLDMISRQKIERSVGLVCAVKTNLTLAPLAKRKSSYI